MYEKDINQCKAPIEEMSIECKGRRDIDHVYFVDQIGAVIEYMYTIMSVDSVNQVV